MEKECAKCGEVKLIEDFYRNNQAKDGRRNICKLCDKQSVKEYRKRNPDKYKEYTRRYHEENREIRNDYNKQYREKNKESISIRTKQWRIRNKGRIKTYQIKYAAINSRKIKEQSKKWALANKDVLSLYQKRRRARKKQLPEDLSLEQQNRILKYFNYGCALSGDVKDIQFDHVIPISTGHGGTTEGNMIPMRADLNYSKHNANIFEWFNDNKERFSLCEEKFRRLIEYLARINGISVREYRDHVYWCHDNIQYFDDEGEAI